MGGGNQNGINTKTDEEEDEEEPDQLLKRTRLTAFITSTQNRKIPAHTHTTIGWKPDVRVHTHTHTPLLSSTAPPAGHITRSCCSQSEKPSLPSSFAPNSPRPRARPQTTAHVSNGARLQDKTRRAMRMNAAGADRGAGDTCAHEQAASKHRCSADL